jgi:tetratricopeptide (TPR) repeat protein
LGLFFILAKRYGDVTAGSIKMTGGKALPVLAIFFVGLCSVLTFLQNKTWLSSVALWENVTSKYPNDALSWNNKGLAHLDLKDYDKAYQSYEQGLKANPQDFDVLYNMGVTLINLKKYPEAIAIYDRALAVKPNYADAYFSRGQAAHIAGAFDKAIADYYKALELGINKPKRQILLAIGISYSEAKQYERAVAVFDEAILEKPEAEIHFRKGNALAASGQMMAAIAAYDFAIGLDPTMVDAYNNKGNALASLQRFAEAIPVFNLALNLNPEGANTRFNLALAKHSLGDRAGACADWQVAAENGYGQAQVMLQQFCK